MNMSVADHDVQPNAKRTWNRQHAAVNLKALEAATRKGGSERSFSIESGVPRTTLQYWRARRDQIEASPGVVAFFESPEGVVFLERLTLAAHFCLTLVGDSGIRLVSAFLDHAGLSGFIGCSYGAQQQVGSELLDLVTAYGKQEQARLAANMPHKVITVCLDETFPAQGQCLVGNEAMKRATAGMKLKVEQVTSDQAKALLRHAKDHDAHHSPDLFHVEQEITRALGLPMSRPVRRAHETLTTSTATLEQHIADQVAYEQGSRRPGRPPSFHKRIQAASEVVAHDQRALDTAREQRARYTAAVHGISDQYHPYGLDTGAPRTADTLSDELHALFTGLYDLASETGASKKAVAKLNKAQRVAPKMVETLAFHHQQVDARVNALQIPQEQRDLLTNVWIPAAHLMCAAPKARTSERTEELRQVAMTLMATHKAQWEGLSVQERQKFDEIAHGCAEIFQRSSSCVEGRNGRLALAEHARRQLPEKKLGALTVIHNYSTRRPDGSTAAERFFGAPPQNLFDWLLQRFSRVPRPAKRRKKAKKTTPVLCG